MGIIKTYPIPKGRNGSFR